MTSEQWQRVKSIVSEARTKDPAARAAFVRDACGGDQTLWREASSLLDSFDHVGDRFEQPLLGTPGAGAALRALIGVEALTDSPADSMIGRRLGPYEIQRELGRGGMGAVYLASRIDAEFTQQVALKITKRGMDTDAIVRRFRTERQILAGLNHPHIARLLDGGTTPEGLPYIVMEYVDGQPITTLLRREPLGPGGTTPPVPRSRRGRGGRAPAPDRPPRHQALERARLDRRPAKAARFRAGDDPESRSGREPRD